MPNKDEGRQKDPQKVAAGEAEAATLQHHDAVETDVL